MCAFSDIRVYAPGGVGGSTVTVGRPDKPRDEPYPLDQFISNMEHLLRHLDREIGRANDDPFLVPWLREARGLIRRVMVNAPDRWHRRKEREEHAKENRPDLDLTGEELAKAVEEQLAAVAALTPRR